MKILKHGDLKLRQFTCKHCCCEFIANMKEYGVSFNGSNFTVYCPECGRYFEQKAPLYKEELDDTCS